MLHRDNKFTTTTDPGICIFVWLYRYYLVFYALLILILTNIYIK